MDSVARCGTRVRVANIDNRYPTSCGLSEASSCLVAIPVRTCSSLVHHQTTLTTGVVLFAFDSSTPFSLFLDHSFSLCLGVGS